MRKNRMLKCLFFLTFVFAFILLNINVALASDITVPSIDVTIGGTDNPAGVSRSLQIFFLLTLITLAPTLILMLTSFTRIIISLHFLRSALATQQMPTNQILIGLALFLTFFLMGPTFVEMNEQVFVPYSQGQMTQDEAINGAMKPIREFMFKQIEPGDLRLFSDLEGVEIYESIDEVPDRVLIPSFIIGEISKGFKIGFIIYIPFIVIDMVVASTLMAMGMMMLPPAMISLPFKILFFILVDGWNLVIGNIIRTFG